MSKQTNTFILSWDMYGLEMCKDITQLMIDAEATDKANIFELIKDPESNPPNDAMRLIGRYITMSTLRARFNNQRNYEVYLLDTEDGITEESMCQEFENNPQSIVDLIRKHGRVLYNGRDNKEQVIV